MAQSVLGLFHMPAGGEEVETEAAEATCITTHVEILFILRKSLSLEFCALLLFWGWENRTYVSYSP